MKHVLLITILFLLAMPLLAQVDSLYLIIWETRSRAAIESVLVTIDTAASSSEYDSIYTDSNGKAVFGFPVDETYTFRLTKDGYYADSIDYIWVSCATCTTVGQIQYPFAKYDSRMCAVVHLVDDSDTMMAYEESLTVSIVDANNDTFFTGQTDSVGVYAWLADSLTDGNTYWVHVHDADSIYNDDYMVFINDATSDNKVIPVQMDTAETATMNTVTVRVFDDATGRAISGISVKRTLGRPVMQEISSAYWAGASTSSTKYYSSDSDGEVEMKVPDNTWVEIFIQEAYGYEAAFFCIQDTVLGQVGVR